MKLSKQLFAIILVLAILATIIIVGSPWHMDEYVMYHRYACGLTAQQLSSSWDGSNCGSNNLPLQLFGITYSRSYPYIGVASSVLIAPFARLYSEPIVSQLVGVIFLFLISLLFQKSLQTPAWSIVIPFLYFPLSYSVIHDSGPIRLSLLAVAATTYTCKLFASSGFRRYAPASFLSFSLSIIALEDKPFFLFLIPGIFFLGLSTITISTQQAPRKRRLFLNLLSYFTLLTLCLAFLLLLTREPTSDLSYFTVLAKSGPSITSKLDNFFESFNYLLNWPYFASRVYPVPRDLVSIPGLISFAFFLSCALLFSFVNQNLRKIFRFSATANLARPAFLLMLVASFLSFYLLIALAGGKFSHHFVFLHVPLILLFMYSTAFLTRRQSSLILCSLTLCIASTVFYLSSRTPLPYTNVYFEPQLREVARFMSLQDVLNCGSWGCYYGNSFAGIDGKAITSAESEEDIASLLGLVKRNNGILYHMCFSNICSVSDLLSIPGVGRVHAFGNPLDGWKVFAVYPD